MKILRVIASLDPKNGGPGQGIRYSIDEMNKRGITNEVVCLDNPLEGYVKERKDNFKIYALGPGKTPWCYNLEIYKWLLLNLNNYDAVIVHGLWLYHGYATYRAAKKINKVKLKSTMQQGRTRFFVMPHGMLDPYFQKAGSRRLKAIRNVFYWYIIECKVIHAAEGILFTSQSELELARETFAYYKPKKEINIGYGIPAPPQANPETAAAFRAGLPGLGQRGYILFLGRIHEKKGVDLLVEAYRYHLQKAAEGNNGENNSLPCLVIAGPGWEEPFGKKITAAISSESLFNNRVFTTGMISGATKWGALNGAEVFVLPSHQENFGIAVAEALACAKPVLITKQVNIWQEIEQDGAGIVKQDTLEGVKGLLDEWFGLKNDEQRLMGENALRCFENRYDIRRPADNLLKAIQ